MHNQILYRNRPWSVRARSLAGVALFSFAALGIVDGAAAQVTPSAGGAGSGGPPVTTTPPVTVTAPAPGDALGSSAASGSGDITPAKATAGDATAVGEVVVTARRREERLRDVPIAATVVTGDSLSQQAGVLDGSNLMASVPGARYDNVSDPVLSEISVRASGTGRATNADSAVGLFWNGTYIPGGLQYGRNFSTIDYFDLDRAKVLRGTQGGLYGRNAVEGVISLVAAQPLFKDAGLVSGTYSVQTGQYIEELLLNHAFNDEVASRLSVEAIQQDSGFVYNPDFHQYVDKTEGWIGRLQVRVKRGNLDADLTAETQQLYLPSNWFSIDVPPGVSAAYAKGYYQPKYIMAHNSPDNTTQHINSLTLNLTYDLKWAVFTSASSVRNRDTFLNSDIDGYDATTFAYAKSLGNTLAGTDINQDRNLNDDTNNLYTDNHLSGDLTSSLSWVGGFDLFRQTSTDYTTQTKTNVNTNTMKSAATTYADGFGFTLPEQYAYNSEGLYASLTYKVIPSVNVSGDVRYTADHKTFSEYNYYLGTSVLYATPINSKLTTSNVSYNLTASWKVPGSWQDLVYIKAGTGYRAGGFNATIGSALAPIPVVPSYNDETTLTYEAGIKGNLTPLLFFTLDTYRSQIHNALGAVSNGCTVSNICGQAATTFVANAGNAVASGVEADLNTTLHILNGILTVHADGSSATSKYTLGPFLGAVIAQDPRWLAGVQANYAHPIPFGASGFVNLVYNGQWGGVQDQVTIVTPRVPLYDYQNVNLRIGVDYQAVEIAAFANNATNNTHPLLYVFDSTTRWSLPRVYGVTAKYKW